MINLLLLTDFYKTMGDKDKDTKHIEALHDLVYLPIQIRSRV
ncbi:hypothetical protein [Clostridium paridis]|nr:hypothetical protein [Clostridium paridis]